MLWRKRHSNKAISSHAQTCVQVKAVLKTPLERGGVGIIRFPFHLKPRPRHRETLSSSSFLRLLPTARRSTRIMSEIRRKLVIVGDGACGKVGSFLPSSWRAVDHARGRARVRVRGGSRAHQEDD